MTHAEESQIAAAVESGIMAAYRKIKAQMEADDPDGPETPEQPAPSK